MVLQKIVENSCNIPTAPIAANIGAKLISKTLQDLRDNAKFHLESIVKLTEELKADIAFTLMDLSLEAEALGLSIKYSPNEPPTVENHPVRSLQQLRELSKIDPFEHTRILDYIYIVRKASEELHVPLCSYITGPFTLAGLLMGVSEIAAGTIISPSLVESVVSFCRDICIEYTNLLTAAGSELIMILEPTAVLLSPNQFEKYCGKYIQDILKRAQIPKCVFLHVCGDSSHLVEKMSKTGVQGLSLDSSVNLSQVPSLNQQLFLMGNIDPILVSRGSFSEVKGAILDLLRQMRDNEKFILSTGCDLPFETPLENVKLFSKVVCGC